MSRISINSVPGINLVLLTLLKHLRGNSLAIQPVLIAGNLGTLSAPSHARANSLVVLPPFPLLKIKKRKTLEYLVTLQNALGTYYIP